MLRRDGGWWMGRIGLALSPWLRFRERPPDPVESLLTAGVSEHRRILLQIQGPPGALEGTTDPERAFARVYALTDVALPRAFAGGADFRLVSAQPTILANRKAAAAVLSSGSTTVTPRGPARIGLAITSGVARKFRSMLSVTREN